MTMEYQILLNSLLLVIIVVMLVLRFKRPIPRQVMCQYHPEIVSDINQINQSLAYLCGMLEQVLVHLGLKKQPSLEPGKPGVHDEDSRL